MDSIVFNGLNPQQKEAVSHAQGPSVILAGAGSGKTRVLIHKVFNLIEKHNVNPSRIVMITFTNKAATEMQERMGKKYKLGYIGTFHSFCSRLLREFGRKIELSPYFSIYDDSDQLQLVKNILNEHGKKDLTPSYVLNRISLAKNELISPQQFLKIFSDHNAKQIALIYKEYQKQLTENSAVDFDDLLVRAIELLMHEQQVLETYQNRYKFFLIDEFQDTNLAQYMLTKLLARKYQNITVVGDFSQSIYSWRGANIDNLEKFKKDFPKTKVFHLEKNYRSTQAILNFAFQIISRNKTHPILHLHTDNVGGDEVIFFEADNEQDEALFIAREVESLQEKSGASSFAVLYRTNAQSRILEEAFLHFSIPYTLIGGVRFYERKEVKDVLAYLRLLINPNDQIAKKRILKLGKKRFEKFKIFYAKIKDTVHNVSTESLMEELFKKTEYLSLYDPHQQEEYERLENIKELKSVAIRFPKLHEFLEQVALVESEYSENEKKTKGQSRIKLMTLHQAKGLEFDYVCIAGVEEGILPHSRSIDDYFQLEEERRLFYVGITRARHKLYITHTRRRFIFGRRGEALKSRFLFEIEDEL